MVRLHRAFSTWFRGKGFADHRFEIVLGGSLVPTEYWTNDGRRMADCSVGHEHPYATHWVLLRTSPFALC